MPKTNIFTDLLLKLLSPIILVYNMSAIRRLRTDENSAKLREMDGPETSKTKYYASGYVSFEKLKKVYKRLDKTSFNDYIMGMMSKAFYDWYSINGIKDPKQIITVIPINLRSLPT